MKRIWFAFSIVIVTLSICIFSLLFTKKVTTNLNSHLFEIEKNLKNNEITLAFKKTLDFEKTWENYGRKLTTFMEHIKIELVDQSVVAMRRNLEEKRREDALVELSKILKLLEQIKESETPTLNNVF
ncbi:MAG: DUF4363 family protein [Oscillospiraceae bacterium]|jgi:hypothetical protein|nr:DUF4363 family protein [Oscillospiraceae bacterium]